jgi:hypothetical protein
VRAVVPEQHAWETTPDGGSRRPGRRFAIVVVALLAGSLIVVSTGSSASGKGTRPGALWNAFPLHVTPKSVFTPPRVTPSVTKLPSAVPPAVMSPHGTSRSPWPLAAALVLLLIGATGATALALRGPAGRWSRAMASAAARGRTTGSTYTFASPALVTAEQSYLLVVPGRLRSRVVERMGIPPFRGELIFDDELGRGNQAYVVEALGPSPLPNDRRPCAMLRRL